MFTKILVPTDGSDSSAKAVQEAVDIASKLNASITLFHVVPPLPTAVRGMVYERQLIEDQMQNGRQILEETKNKISDQNLNVNVDIEMVPGDPAYEICLKAKEDNYDLIVIGNRGLGEIKSFLMGSISRRVSRHAPCSVLVVR
ncbi:universal stress protein [Desulfallas sp. Bu1-1]|uniref:universal stress protein n=1 Tax=Desulfallas sp. Bu1-1 TaxID=2787620 RepID=UPI00189E0DE2|nr:universal stress protein [Desulfallas sp. Bu1-1]MBF7082476.1 universal stress protein [Desulfallas sp. Bu1-1]